MLKRHCVNLKIATIEMAVSKRVKEVKGRALLRIGMDVAAIVAKPKPLESIVTNVRRSHGRPKQKRISKMLEPIELHNAISTKPDFFTRR